MRWEISSFILAVLFFNHSAFAVKTAEEYWKETGLNTSHARISNAICNASEKAFSACLHSLSAALSVEKTRLVLVPVSRTKEKGFGKVEKDFTSVVAVERKKAPEQDLAALYADIRAEKKISSDAIAQLYKERATNPVDFEEIFDWVKTGTEFKAKEALVVGEMLNIQVGILKDPHTRFMPSAQLRDENTEGARDVVGIGALIKSLKKEGKSTAVISQPIEGGPAFKAGLKANDVITHVDGLDIADLPLTEIINKIRGPKGSTVKLTIQRGPDTLEVPLVRELVKQNNVTKTMIGAKNDVAYIKLSDFMRRDSKGNTLVYSESADALKELIGKKPKGIIFDLRDNGGGLLTESVRIASLFLKEKSPVVSTKTFNSSSVETLKTSAKDKPLTDLPLVVLINARSASASEIVAGALQDHARAYLIGERSFGKGTVQAVTELDTVSNPFISRMIDPILNPFLKAIGSTDKLAILHTIAYFLLPSGRSNQVESVLPDVEVFTSPTPSESDKVAMREEDEYAVLPTPLGKKWVQPRPREVKKLKECMAKGAATTEFAAGASAAIPPDFQLLSGIDAVGCIVDEKLDVPPAPVRPLNVNETIFVP